LRAITLIVASALFVGYCFTSGQWHPRVIHDASGRPILFAELSPPPHTFGGVTSGVTSEELLRAKGHPVKEQSNDWIYNSIDPAHDGVLDVYLTDGSAGHPAAVWAVLFWGKREAEPPGTADLLAFARQDLVMRYGTPRSESDGGEDTKYLYFHDGLVVWLDADNKVEAYGVYNLQQ
jgi:hypothetical protein